MADGAYERRGPREAELARIKKTMAQIRAKAADGGQRENRLRNKERGAQDE